MTTCNNIILFQPNAGETLNREIPDDVSARLNFGPEEIAGLRMGGDGQLIIDFADGGQINITNFTEVVDNGNLIYLNDGTLVDPSILTSSYQSPQEFNNIEAAAGAEANATLITQPAANTTQEISLEQGMKYVCDFDPANAATVETIDGKMVLTFADGSQVIINNYQTAMMGDLPAVLTLEDGNVIEGEEILTQVVEVQEFSEIQTEPVEEILEFTETAPETVANIEPAAGDADVVQALAQIEPASGEAGVGNTGYGFNSSPTDAPLNSPFAIGPLGATNLAYSAPQFSSKRQILIDPTPIISESRVDLDETNLSDDLVAEGKIDVNFGTDGVGSFQPNGGFRADCEVAGGKLQSQGVDVVVTQKANGYEGVANGVTVFTFVLDANTGEYVYTQLEPFDHADTSDTNEAICLHFGVVVSDSDGDTASTDVRVNVLDDAPTVEPQTILKTDETYDVVNGVLTKSGQFVADMGQDVGGTFTGNGTFTSTGSIANGELASGGNPVVVSYDAATNTYTGVAGGETIFTVVINPETGAYTYTQYAGLDHADGSDDNDHMILNFGVDVTDFDGDTASDRIRIEVCDDGPSIHDASNTVDETNLANPLVATGTVAVDFGFDGKGSIGASGTFTSGGSQTNGTLTHNGVAVVVTQTANGYIGVAGGVTVFTLEIDSSTGAYTFTQVENLDHADVNDPNDVITLNFGTVVTDGDGDTANGTITINIVDDAPVANDDVVALTNADQTATGNVLGNDVASCDDQVFEVSTPGTYEGQYGTLVLNADGSYTYTRNGQQGGTDTFEYSVIDTDGDTDTATLTVTVAADYNPIHINGVGETDDTNLNDDGMDMITGTINVDYQGDGPGTTAGNGDFASAGNRTGNTLSHNGAAVTVSFDAATNTYTGVAGHTTVFTMVINSDGTYKFTQLENLDHSNDQADNEAIFLDFGVTATDADGDTGAGTVRITVRDDAPVAADDTATIGNTTTVTGNVLTNDDFGADDTKVEVYNPGTYEGQFGTLVLNIDGTYTYTRNGREDGVDTFEYKICDGDHDVDTATLTINLGKMNDEPEITTSVTGVNEVELCDGPLVVNKTLVHDFGDDGAGAITVNGESAVKFKVGGQDQTLTVDGTPVSITTTNNNGYVGTANGQTIFTLTLNSQTGEYTYTQYAGVDHPGVGLAGTDDVIWLKLGVTITDADGDSANAYVNIDIRDTAPEAHNDTKTVSEGNTANGNVLSNDENCEAGSTVCEVVFGNQTIAVPATGTVSVTGQYGVLTISANGAYSYVANTNNPDGIDVFTYTMKDQDGDTSSANLSINVTSIDTVPTIEQFNNPYSECGVVDGPIVIQETLTHDFGADGAGAITPTGEVNVKFKLGGPTETLTSDGVPVVFTQTANGYVGKAGGETVISLVIDPATGEYTYKQFAQVDHQAPGTDGDDVIWIVFGVQISDADGDTASTYIVIDVSDAEPVAHDDVNAVEEGEVVDGNVLNNDENCADEGSAVCEVVFGNQTIAVPATGTISVTGQYGVLTIAANGTYSYQANNNNPDGVDVFTYTMKDADGDTSTANLSITVTKDDVNPINISGSGETDDTNVAANVLDDIEGVINVNYQGDGPGETCGNGNFSTAGNLFGGELTSGGDAVTVTFDADANTYRGVLASGATVFVMTINEDGTFFFRQAQPLDHSNDQSDNEAIFLDFGVTAKDSDGDTGTGTVRITVRDDAPSAVNDVASLADDQTSVTGNVLTNDDIGADTEKFEVYNPGTFQGQYGTLVLRADGTYTYTRNGDEGGTDVFEYQICDFDHDIDTATLTITTTTILDFEPININGVGQTDDTNLLDDGMDMITGNINVNYQGDGPGTTAGNGDFGSAGQRLGGALTSGGVPVNVTFNAGSNTYTGKAGTETVFTMVINANGTYKFTQFGDLDHSNTNSDNEALFLDFGVTATDSDGDTGTGTVRITVRDDAPEAADDTAVANQNGVARGNVLANDDTGADNGANVMVTTAGTFEGQYGTLVLNMDGSYTYTRNGREGGTDVFNYTMKDHDGDTSSAQLTVTVGRENDVPTITKSVTGVNEDAFCDHATLVVNKTLVHDFGDDGAGSIRVNGDTAVKFKVGGQNQTLTVDGVPVVITQSGNGYVGKAGNLTVFTMSLNSNTGEYTYTQFTGVDHPGVGATGTNDVIWLNLGVTITDSDGDSADSYVQIDIRDTAPEAVDDKVFTTGGVEVDHLSLNLSSGDVAGTQSSFTRDGITISSNNGEDLTWYNADDGSSGAGISGGGSDKVWSSGEVMQVRFANTVTATTINIGEVGNNIGKSITYTVYLADGTSRHESFQFTNANVSNGSADITIDGYASDIVGVDFTGGVSFTLGDVDATSYVATGGDAVGNVLLNDDICEDHDVSVTAIKFGNQSYNIAEGGQRIINGEHGTLTIKSDGTYSYKANTAPSQTVHSFNIDNPAGNDSGGDIKNVSTQYNETTKDFTFTMVTDAHADGVEFAVNDGPNPKGHPGELAFFYIDGTGAEPVVTVYGYNGVSVHSWKDGGDAAGNQPADKIFSSITNPELFDNIVATTNPDGTKTYSVSLNVEALQNHDPLYGPDGIWEGVDFSQNIGIWAHTLSDLETSYGNDGFLTEWSYSGLGWYDSSNQNAQTTVIPGSAGGEDTFTYTIMDADGDTSTATLTFCPDDFHNVVDVVGNGSYYGTNESDLFILDAINDGAPILRDFDINEDAVDISALIEGYDPVTDAINDFVHVTNSGAGDDTWIYIDAHGNGANNQDKLSVRLDNTGDNTLEDLLANGNLIV